MPKPRIEFDEARHEYRVNGRVTPSVTQVLKAVGLLADYDNLDPFYAERGHAVHAACEFDDKGTLDEESVDEEVAGFLAAWRALKKESGLVVVEIETVVTGPGYAGRVDRVVEIKGRRGVLDIKTGQPAAWHQLQTAAYAMALFRESSCPRWAAYLKQDGTFRIDEHDDVRDYMGWSGALSLSGWLKEYGG